MSQETKLETWREQHPLKNYVVVSRLFEIIHQACTPHWTGWFKHEMVNLSFVCPEWASEARKYIHRRDEYGRFFYFDSWLTFELDNALCSHVTAVLPPDQWPPLGPCVTNIDASWTGLSAGDARKISRLMPALETLVGAVLFSRGADPNACAITFLSEQLKLQHPIVDFPWFGVPVHESESELHVGEISAAADTFTVNSHNASLLHVVTRDDVTK
ncbi:hypothetical protein Fcan01_15433 [Folsomia candida]|uniref:Uncharacterized protein n=1 Tax=Folsomia candida TaxID=158441 RepID=A0A226DWW5_FOLCA|nr:hypothetical protein Fcan01_15433 [Folsomia candida]